MRTVAKFQMEAEAFAVEFQCPGRICDVKQGIACLIMRTSR